MTAIEDEVMKSFRAALLLEDAFQASLVDPLIALLADPKGPKAEALAALFRASEDGAAL